MNEATERLVEQLKTAPLFITMKEAARLLHISQASLVTLANQDKLPWAIGCNQYDDSDKNYYKVATNRLIVWLKGEGIQ